MAIRGWNALQFALVLTVVMLMATGCPISKTVPVPDVTGEALATAQTLLGGSGLTVGTLTGEHSTAVPAGCIISQNPAAGTGVAPASSVDLLLSKGPEPVSVPDVAGLSQSEAETALANAGLAVGTITQTYDDTAAADTVIGQAPTAGTSTVPGTAVNLVVSKGPQPVAVPNVIGLSQAHAQSAIINAGLAVGTLTQAYDDVAAQGTVLDQEPAAGTSAVPGTAINLVISNGPEPVDVPDVVGLTQADAQAAITNAELTIGTVTQAFDDTVPPGHVVSEAPAAGTSVLPGTPVALVISKGPEPVVVPNVVGLTQPDAEAALAGVGLGLGAVTEQLSSTVPDGYVISQHPASGTTAPHGSVVELVVSKGSVPNLVGLSQAEAEAAILAAGLSVGDITERYSDTQSAGAVVLHTPPAGSLAPAGTAVDLVIAKTPEPGAIGLHDIEELQKIGNDPAYPLGGTYFLNNDIDALVTAQWNDGNGFAPLGSDTPFEGVLDGQGYTVSGLFIKRPDVNDVGLFSQTNGATIQNLTLRNCSIQGLKKDIRTPLGGKNVGAVVGTNQGVLSNCHVEGSVDGFRAVGALIGYNLGTVDNCSSSGTLNAVFHAGGLVGMNTGVVSNSFSTCNVTGQYNLGGLIGTNDEGEVTDCHAAGVVSGEFTVGGLIGSHVGSTAGTTVVTRNYATGNCFGVRYIGGLIGSSAGFSSPVSACFATGDVMGSTGVGGLMAGSFGLVSNCYSSGLVTGDSDTGGLIAYQIQGDVLSSFWDMDTSGQQQSAGGVGKTTAQMISRSTFESAGWDMADTWTLTDGASYPHFKTNSSEELGQNAISVTTNGHGTATGVPGGSTAQAWAPVVLTATPDPGYAFVGWEGAGIADPSRPLPLNPLTLVVTRDTTVRARFLPDMPVEIADIDALQRIGNDPDYPLNWDYVQTSDIDALETICWNGNLGFEPIGTRGGAFSGSYDGQNYLISDLFIGVMKGVDIGLFARISAAGIISNTHIQGGEANANAAATESALGLLAGTSLGTAISCSAIGIVGGSYSDSSAAYAGGLVGANGGTVTRSHAGGSVRQGQYAGGLVGSNGGEVSDSFATAEVFGSQSAGGLIATSGSGPVSRCYATGAVNWGADAGGLIGEANGTEITECYATGNVNSGGGGGLIGSASRSLVTASFWNTETTGQSTSAGGTGKTTTEMMTLSTFTNAGWDFASTWTMQEGLTYPYFQWE